jgi:N-acetylmuramoyl-L-alanine amidase
MRAVGHVIRNRKQVESHGAYVTDTVSAAFQFSCWNPDDPNRKVMLNIDALPEESEDHRLWMAAKRLADEILSGRSAYPTGGALFYHTTAVRPAWSRGGAPIARIGDHLFFRTVP